MSRRPFQLKLHEPIPEPVPNQPRFVARYDVALRQWVIVDVLDGAEIVVRGGQHVAIERAALASGVWRLKERRRAEEEAILLRVRGEGDRSTSA